MADSDYTLTFELRERHNVLDIHCNDEGLENLIDALTLLVEGKHDHLHLMTPSWGGVDLSENKQSETSTLLNQVNIYKW